MFDESPLLRFPVRNHIIFNPVVNLAGYHSALHKVRLGVIRPETNNASGPTRRHAGNFQQLLYAGVIDVDALLGRRRCLRSFGHTTGVPILVLRCPSQANAQHHNRCRRISHSRSHGSILRPALDTSQP